MIGNNKCNSKYHEIVKKKKPQNIENQQRQKSSEEMNKQNGKVF